MATMHETQRTYALALAAYETALAACHAEIDATCPEPLNGAPDAEWEAYYARCDAMHEVHQTSALRDALRVATDLMIDWSMGRARKYAKKAGKSARDLAALEHLSTQRHRIVVLDRLTEIAFRLAA